VKADATLCSAIKVTPLEYIYVSKKWKKSRFSAATAAEAQIFPLKGYRRSALASTVHLHVPGRQKDIFGQNGQKRK